MRIDALGTSAPLTKEAARQLSDLKKACEQFEAVFAKQLLGEMRKGVKETQIGDQAGSAIYKDMMDQAIADSVAKQGSLGIGKMLFRQFEKQVMGSMPAPQPQGEASPGQAAPGEASIRTISADNPGLGRGNSMPAPSPQGDQSPLKGPISMRGRN